MVVWLSMAMGWVRPASFILFLTDSTFFSAAVSGVWMHESYLFTPTGFLRYFGFAQLYANHTIINGGIPVAWSLSVEMTYYLSLPGLAWLARRLGPRFGRIGSEFAVLAPAVGPGPAC